MIERDGHHGSIGHSKELKWFNITYSICDREFVKLVKSNSFIGALTLYERIKKDNYELVDILIVEPEDLPDS